MRFISLYCRFCFFCTLLFTALGLEGQSGTFTNMLEGVPLVGGETMLVEINDLNTSSGGELQNRAYYGSDSRLYFVVKQDGGAPVPQGDYELLVEVACYRGEGFQRNSTPDLYTLTLTVAANAAGGAIPLASADIQNAWKMEIEVLGVSYEGGPVASSGVRMQLIGEISEERKGCSNYTIELDHPQFSTGVDAEGKAVATVGTTACADEYDFEYVFFDAGSKEAQRIADRSSTYPIDELFRNNSTRLTSKAELFRTFNLYRKGVVVARYRAVYYDGAGNRTFTKWSSTGKSLATLGAAGETTNSPGIIEVGHQPEYNWQATTNFAEEAKQLPSVSYLDGTMRGRQNLVLQYGEQNGVPDPSTEYAIGQQTIYDAMGRPAVSVLPAPLYPGDDALHPLRFDPRKLATPVGVDPTVASGTFPVYGVDEVEADGACGAAPLGQGSGAGKFYSPANNEEQNKFVPNAFGYPFAVTRYTPDNTGRVRQQGGVGPQLQVGAHDTRYFYGKPNQWELDRLFGVNVGNASHYQKTMVIDPNGQATVSYLDAKGRTIATALAGAAPKNLIPISQVIADYTFATAGTDESGLTIDFTNESIEATEFGWNFADLGSSTEQDPSFTFPEEGTYVVCLTATGATGTETTCQYVSAAAEPDLADDVITLAKGFNLVSLDVAPADSRIKVIFAELLAEDKLLYVQERNAQGGLELFIPKLGDESVLTRMEPGRGYMVGVTEEVSVTIQGLTIESDYRPTLYPGANIISYLPQEAADPVTYLADLIPGEENLVFVRSFSEGRFHTYRPSYMTEAPFEMTNGQAYEVFIGSEVAGDDYLKEYGGENGTPTGPLYGEELYEANRLDRDPLLIGDENDMTASGTTDGNGATSSATITTSILNNTRYADRVTSTYSLLVAEAGRYDICYALSSATYCEGCQTDESPVSICVDCQYDVTITIAPVNLCSDDDAVEFKPIELTERLAGGSFSDCFADTEHSLNDLLLTTGEYVITKTVTLTEAAVTEAVAEYMGNAECIDTETEYLTTALEDIDEGGCFECNCEDADLSPECESYCRTPSPCEVLREQLLGDLYPGSGQYARYRIDYDKPLGAPDRYVLTPDPEDEADNPALAYTYSIFQKSRATSSGELAYQTVSYGDLGPLLIDGEQIEIADLPLSAFIDNFDPTWVAYLLPLHPEYELLGWCESNLYVEKGTAANSSHHFDELLRRTNTYDEATDSRTLSGGFISGSLDEGTIRTAVGGMVSKDPFLKSQSGTVADGTRIDALQIEATVLAQMNELFGPDEAYVWPGENDERSFLRDVVWQLVRDLYLAQKALVVNQIQFGENEDIASEHLDLSWTAIPQPLCKELLCHDYEGNRVTGMSDFYTARVPRLALAKVIAADPPETASDLTDPVGPFAEQLADLRQRTATRCNEVCSSYRPTWEAELRQCATFATVGPDSIDAVLDELEAICAGGCQGGAVWGSSTLPEGVAERPTGRNSFEEVITYYIGKYGGTLPTACTPVSEESANCTSDLISFPLPAGREQYGGTLVISREQAPLWLMLNAGFLRSRLDYFATQCACNSCGTPKAITERTLSDGQIATIAQLNRLSGVVVEDLLDVIVPHAAGNFAAALAALKNDLFIPAEFNPNGTRCYTAELLQQKYVDQFPECPDLEDDEYDLKLTAFLNQELGWNRSWQEYASVLEGGPDGSCLICADPPATQLIADEDLDCKQEVRQRAEQIAYHEYERYLDNRSTTFERAYRAHCLGSLVDPTSPERERLELRYTPREYHYTLYYYDQAGNLAMTVPPGGVKPLPRQKGPTVTAVRQRVGPGTYPPVAEAATALPHHELLTHYRYNSFNEVVVSDAPDRDIAQTWYDRLGRAVFSRDGRQRSDNLLSYTIYDRLGRPEEVGEIEVADLGSILPQVDNDDLGTFIRNRYRERAFVTRTFYSETQFAREVVPHDPYLLRNRVAATTFRATTRAGEESMKDRDSYDFASHYTYDIAGNVESLVQEFRDLDEANRFKRLDYTYDLISGNVHYLHYQRGKADQFTYHYDYDQLNRLTEVFTSEFEVAHSNSVLWKRDAQYHYYDHGPLRRTVLGQDRLQGLDYAYTLQGWIKGVNGSLGDDYRHVAAPDLTMDGFGDPPTVNSGWVSHRDLYRYANQYFNGDYHPIGGGSILNPMDNVLPPDYELFNGNIVRHYQSSAADGFRTAGLVGEYDQLNRLRFGTNAFYGRQPDQTALADALEAPVYDGNGNIRTLDRRYATTEGQGMTNRLGYRYTAGTNLLTQVQARAEGSASGADWQPFSLLRGNTTYAYDRSGNLTTEQDDQSATATTITWNPYGKVTAVDSPTGQTTFGYGPDQNRWRKSFGDGRTTYYVRDAQGNTLATYELGGAAGGSLVWRQQYLFGSARLGEVIMDRALPAGPATPPVNFGERRYELTNHLGNVTTVFGEYARQYADAADGTTYTAPDLLSYRDYFAFGLGLERAPGEAGQGYRYGFNGKEKDDEGEWGEGQTAYDYGFRIYNPGIARFLSVDPLSPDYPWYTPYQFAGNNPIKFVDLDGLEPGESGEYSGQGAIAPQIDECGDACSGTEDYRWTWNGSDWLASSAGVTGAELSAIFPQGKATSLRSLEIMINSEGSNYGLNDQTTISHFLSQAGHEVGGFAKGLGVAESLNYSVSGLVKVFGKYFYAGDTPVDGKYSAEEYGRKRGQSANQEGIANITYANRMGNGDFASGDGFRFRGRGIFQLTGRINYTNFNNFMQSEFNSKEDFLAKPGLLLENDYSIRSAMWFFKVNVINRLDMSSASVRQVTKKVNGGRNGLEDRQEIFNTAESVIVRD